MYKTAKTKRGRKIQSRAFKKLFGYHSAYCGGIEFLSRKEKKYYIGTKLNKNKIRRRLAEMIIYIDENGDITDYSDHFCPECGCEVAKSTGNSVPYPEVFERVLCMRCGFLMGEADNSPHHSFFELDDGEYWQSKVTIRKNSDATDKDEFKNIFK